MGADTTLVANELSSERKNRLIRVLDEFLEPTLRQRVKVTGFDAARWSRFEKGTFGAILLDAPCSSERHVLTSPKHLQEWSPARIRNLAFRQWALLSGAADNNPSGVSREDFDGASVDSASCSDVRTGIEEIEGCA